MWVDISGLSKWECVAEFAVGGLEWIGFSEKYPEKLLCISSQKTTVFDCENATIHDSYCEYDEDSFTAICDLLPNEEIAISGQYGGNPIWHTAKKESVKVQTASDFITTVSFIDDVGNESIIFNNYGFYTCGFNCVGTYFVFSHDGGITVLRKTEILTCSGCDYDKNSE